MTEPLPLAVNADQASIARLYNFYLGGQHYYEVDATLGSQVIQRCPFVREIAADNRLFHERAVQFLLDEGVRQFLDVGAGIPAWKSTYEIVRAVSVDACVISVDISAEARVLSRSLIDGDRRAAAVNGDFRLPDSILRHPETRRLVDFSEPVAVLGTSLLPCITDAERPHALIGKYMDRLCSGSYLALSHTGVDHASPSVRTAVSSVADIYKRAGLTTVLRTVTEFEEFFDSLTLVDSVTFACDWRPSVRPPPDYPARACSYAAVGHKP